MLVVKAADDFEMSALSDLALKEFQKKCAETWNTPEFWTVVEDAFATNIYERVRDSLIVLISASFSELQKNRSNVFWTMLDHLPALSKTLLLSSELAIIPRETIRSVNAMCARISSRPST